MAAGLADDLASTLLLASDKPVLIAPAMNPQMWAHPATRRNVAPLVGATGCAWSGPNPGDMACGEVGLGRMAEPLEILAAIEALAAAPRAGRCRRLRALVTSGPDPRADRSGPLPLQPFLRQAGTRHRRRRWPKPGRRSRWSAARSQVPDPAGVTTVARRDPRAQMLAAERGGAAGRHRRLAAAVADWRAGADAGAQDKKRRGRAAAGAASWSRTRTSCARWRHARTTGPALVIGFAAETGERRSQGPRQAARARAATGSSPTTSRPVPACSAATSNRILLLTADGQLESWPELDKLAVARRLAMRIAAVRSGGHGRWVTCGWRSSACRMPRTCRCRPMPPSRRRASICWRRCRPMCRSCSSRSTTCWCRPVFALALPVGYEAQVRPRSGLALRHAVTVLNSPGTIDADYRGEVGVILINLGRVPYVIERATRIAQLVIAPVARVSLHEEFLDGDVTGRGAGGFRLDRNRVRIMNAEFGQVEGGAGPC